MNSHITNCEILIEIMNLLNVYNEGYARSKQRHTDCSNLRLSYTQQTLFSVSPVGKMSENNSQVCNI